MSIKYARQNEQALHERQVRKLQQTIEKFQELYDELPENEVSKTAKMYFETSIMWATRSLAEE